MEYLVQVSVTPTLLRGPSLTLLFRAVLSAAAAVAPCLKNTVLGPGALQAIRIFHTRQPSLAPIPCVPEYGGKVCLGLIPKEFFQFLYPKTGVRGPYVL
ncbi:ATP synthase F(0) complex subunit B1, mitochondrial [Vulpes lagopus]